jgi:hypothetical protein
MPEARRPSAAAHHFAYWEAGLAPLAMDGWRGIGRRAPAHGTGMLTGGSSQVGPRGSEGEGAHFGPAEGLPAEIGQAGAQGDEADRDRTLIPGGCPSAPARQEHRYGDRPASAELMESREQLSRVRVIVGQIAQHEEGTFFCRA